MAGIRASVCSLAAGGLEIVHAAEGVTLNAHSHDKPHILLMLHGALHEEARVLTTGDLRISPAGDRHFVRFSQPSTCLLLQLSNEHELGAAERIFARTDHKFLDSMRSLVVGEISDRAPEIFENAVNTARRAAEQHGAAPIPPWLTELRRYVSIRAEEVNRIGVLARRAGVSREHLTRTFRRHYGVAVSDFLRTRRMIRAFDQIAESTTPLVDISADCGFSDQSHMTRLFSSHFGISPAALRSKHNPTSHPFKSAAPSA